MRIFADISTGLASYQQWDDSSVIWDLFDLRPLASSGLQTYLNLTLSRCVQWFQADGGSIFLQDSSKTFRLRAKSGTLRDVPDHASFKLGEGIAGVVAESGTPRIVGDPSHHPEFPQSRFTVEIGSAIVIPLVNGQDEPLGVLNLSRAKGKTPFQPTEMEHVAALASTIAMAVNNAELVEELVQRVEEKNKANEKLNALLDSVGGPVFLLDSQARKALNRDAVQLELSGGFTDSLQEFMTACTDHEGQKTFFDTSSQMTWAAITKRLSFGSYVLALTDITELEEKNKELARTQRLAEIGQMTASIAHEIRNPLTGIMSAAQMLGSSPELLDEFLPMIVEESARLNRLCESFLNFARPLTLQCSKFPLVNLIDRVVAVEQSRAIDRGVELVHSGDSSLLVYGDYERLLQVLLNLVRNGVDACSPGGQVSIELRGGKLRVKDTGKGIPADQVQQVFSPFFTTKSHGTGLGLSLSKKIADAHGIDLNVESIPGQGSEFILDLRNMIRGAA